MKDFMFIHENKKPNKVLLPSCYEREGNIIPGLYTTNSIRFYQKRIDTLVNSEFLKENTNLSPKKIAEILRYIRSCMAPFDIKDDYICLKGTGTSQEDSYDFKSGIVVVKNNKYMDVVPKIEMTEYLKNYGFDETKEEEILSNINTVLSNVPNKKITYTFKK